MTLPTFDLTLNIDTDNSLVVGARWTVRLDRDLHWEGQEVPDYFEAEMVDSNPVVTLASTEVDADACWIVVCTLPNGHRLYRRCVKMDADKTTISADGGGTVEPPEPIVPLDLVIDVAGNLELPDDVAMDQVTEDDMTLGRLIRLDVQQTLADDGQYFLEGKQRRWLVYNPSLAGDAQVPTGIYWATVMQPWSHENSLNKAGLLQIIADGSVLQADLPAPTAIPEIEMTLDFVVNNLGIRLEPIPWLGGNSYIETAAGGTNRPIRIYMNNTVPPLSGQSPFMQNLFTGGNGLRHTFNPSGSTAPKDSSPNSYYPQDITIEKRYIMVHVGVHWGFVYKLSDVELAADLPLTVTGEWEQ